MNDTGATHSSSPKRTSPAICSYHERNAEARPHPSLTSPPSRAHPPSRSTSSSAYIRQLEDQQAAIRARLADLGVEDIRTQLEHASLRDPDEHMNVDPAPPPASAAAQPTDDAPRPISAKQRALARWVSTISSADLAAPFRVTCGVWRRG